MFPFPDEVINLFTWITRAEQHGDIAEIRAVNLAAFPGEDEADLVEALRSDPQA